MELSVDWKVFREFFYPSRSHLEGGGTKPPLWVVSQGSRDAVIWTSSDLMMQIPRGASVDEVLGRDPSRKVIVTPRDQLHQWLMEGLDDPHVYDQILHLQLKIGASLSPSGRRRRGIPLPEKGLAVGPQHFLLVALRGWWQRFLPINYGIYLQLEGEHPRSILLRFQRNRLNSFHTPDLQSLPSDKRRNPAEIVHHLTERYFLPIQGIFLTREQWAGLLQTPRPWPRVLALLRRNAERLVPFRWGTVFLITLRACSR